MEFGSVLEFELYNIKSPKYDSILILHLIYQFSKVKAMRKSYGFLNFLYTYKVKN